MTSFAPPSADDMLRHWSVVHSGPAQSGDKFWDYRLQSWLPVTGGKIGQSVRCILTVVIRRD